MASTTDPQVLANGQAPRGEPRRKVVVINEPKKSRSNILLAALASLISLGMHAVLIFLILQLNLDVGEAQAEEIKATETIIQDEPEEDFDLTQLDIGIDPKIDTQFNVERIEEVSVPGMVNPTEAVGIVNAPEAPAKTLPAPPGTGQGTGAAMPSIDAGTGSMYGSFGGSMGITNPGGFGGRSGSTRKQMVAEGGGNELSEACVAAGLKWLALHQAPDGHWSLHNFNSMAREKPIPAGRVFRCNCDPVTSRQNDIAGTGFSLLPFLAAGQTHRPTRDSAVDYSKSVMGGLSFLIKKQGQNGFFGGDMYSHGLCTIAMCEAYGMTSDPYLKVAAQKAINYIVYAQDPAGGGWRYSARTPGDLSVTGWQLMGLKSGQMCGLNVPKETLVKAERYLDDSEDSNGGFSYTPGSGSRYTMTAVGLLCRQYMGVNPRNPKLIKGVQSLKRYPPGATKNMYYEYYATQVMHHMGGESWNFWNLGPDGKGTNGIRDQMIRGMYRNTDGKKPHQEGSWTPLGSGHANDGGRIMSTSLSLLMLEVYYRHLPLYRRDLGVVKDPG